MGDKKPEYVRCPECNSSIPTYPFCKLCDANLQALINKYPSVFQETVFDKLNPKLEMILREVTKLNNTLDAFKIRGFKLKSTKI